ncbi:MAG: hypothetical protein H0V05_21370 [Euzebyaceae bacterium]|jgi:hypothetical protein|nr:hypothetical protein [Euzebyaceae bacterium]
MAAPLAETPIDLATAERLSQRFHEVFQTFDAGDDLFDGVPLAGFGRGGPARRRPRVSIARGLRWEHIRGPAELPSERGVDLD